MWWEAILAFYTTKAEFNSPVILLAVNFNYQNLPNERVLFGKPFTIKLLSSAFNEF